MIIVKLMGGLGNQMFQYALGRHLALKHRTELKFDVTFLLDRTPRPDFVYREYDLGIFGINAGFATQEEIALFAEVPRSAKLRHRLRQALWPHYYIREQHPRFDGQVLCAPDNSYLEGYWQSEKYFQAVEQDIRKDFSFTPPPSPEIGSLAAEIESCNAVCVNVRRADFVDNPVANKHHGVCGMEYFSRAIDVLAGKLAGPRFYVFSDDIDWCRQHFAALQHPATIVDHAYAGKAFRDYLYLMTRCRHFIIPNSTFGWWAAWLADYPEKTVIAPSRWFSDPGRDTSDLIPPTWLRL